MWKIFLVGAAVLIAVLVDEIIIIIGKATIPAVINNAAVAAPVKIVAEGFSFAGAAEGTVRGKALNSPVIHGLVAVFLTSFGGFHNYGNAFNTGIIKGMIYEFRVAFGNFKKGIGGMDVDLTDGLAVNTGTLNDFPDEITGADAVVFADIDEEAGAAS